MRHYIRHVMGYYMDIIQYTIVVNHLSCVPIIIYGQTIHIINAHISPKGNERLQEWDVDISFHEYPLDGTLDVLSVLTYHKAVLQRSWNTHGRKSLAYTV